MGRDVDVINKPRNNFTNKALIWSPQGRIFGGY